MGLHTWAFFKVIFVTLGAQDKVMALGKGLRIWVLEGHCPQTITQESTLMRNFVVLTLARS